jgi:hypothetical protein
MAIVFSLLCSVLAPAQTGPAEVPYFIVSNHEVLLWPADVSDPYVIAVFDGGEWQFLDARDLATSVPRELKAQFTVVNKEPEFIPASNENYTWKLWAPDVRIEAATDEKGTRLAVISQRSAYVDLLPAGISANQANNLASIQLLNKAAGRKGLSALFPGGGRPDWNAWVQYLHALQQSAAVIFEDSSGNSRWILEQHITAAEWQNKTSRSLELTSPASIVAQPRTETAAPNQPAPTGTSADWTDVFLGCGLAFVLGGLAVYAWQMWISVRKAKVKDKDQPAETRQSVQTLKIASSLPSPSVKGRRAADRSPAEAEHQELVQMGRRAQDLLRKIKETSFATPELREFAGSRSLLPNLLLALVQIDKMLQERKAKIESLERVAAGNQEKLRLSEERKGLLQTKEQRIVALQDKNVALEERIRKYEDSIDRLQEESAQHKQIVAKALEIGPVAEMCAQGTREFAIQSGKFPEIAALAFLIDYSLYKLTESILTNNTQREIVMRENLRRICQKAADKAVPGFKPAMLDGSRGGDAVVVSKNGRHPDRALFTGVMKILRDFGSLAIEFDFDVDDSGVYRAA